MSTERPSYVAQLALADRGDLDVTSEVAAMAQRLQTELRDALRNRCGISAELCGLLDGHSSEEGELTIQAIHRNASGDGRPAIRIITDLECVIACALEIILEDNLIGREWMPGDFFPVQYGIIPATSPLALVSEPSPACMTPR